MSGARGERGPRGDHGQRGDTGDSGEPHSIGLWIIGALVALQALTLISGIILIGQGRESHRENVQSGYNSCEGQNDLRYNDREFYINEIEQSKTLRPSQFPGFEPKEFRRLIREQRERHEQALRRAYDRDCEEEFPEAEWEPGGRIGLDKGFKSRLDLITPPDSLPGHRER